jgi:uncharacterized Zn finger protein (UPF0148 family)
MDKAMSKGPTISGDGLKITCNVCGTSMIDKDGKVINGPCPKCGKSGIVMTGGASIKIK